MPSFRSIALLLGLSALVGPVFAADLTISATTYSSSTPHFASTSGSITTSGTVTVSSGGNATFEATVQVRLATGFQASTGSVFRAVAADTDTDGLPDSWEMRYFGSLQYGAGYSPPGVGRTLAQSLASQLDPTDIDTDFDGLGDLWENRYFGGLQYDNPSLDPFGVGRTLGQSYAQNLSPLPLPVVASGLRAWYRADQGVIKDGSNSVSKWVDASGHGLHVASDSSDPLWVDSVANGKPGIEFGAGEHLESEETDLLGSSEDFTVIAVVASEDEQSSQAIPVIVDFTADNSSGLSLRLTENLEYALSFRDSTNTNWQGDLAPLIGVSADNSAQALMFIKNGTVQTAFLSNNPEASSTVAAAIHAPSGTIRVGGFYNGKVCEILIYDRALNSTEREQINAALTTKYFPSTLDSDDDGLPDAWEWASIGNLNSGANDDPDSDGLTNLQELEQGLRARWADNPAISLSIFTPNS